MTTSGPPNPGAGLGFADLASIASIGTAVRPLDRHQLPTAVVEATGPEATSEDLLLRAAAVWALHHRADIATVPASAEGTGATSDDAAPTPVTLPGDPRPLISEAASGLIRRAMVSPHHRDMVGEALDTVGQLGLGLPLSLQLHAAEQRVLTADSALAGPQLRALAAHEPGLLRGDTATAAPSGDPVARATELVGKGKAKDREQAVRDLSGLTRDPRVGDLLEQFLDDRVASVRRAAAGALLGVEGSPLMGRFEALAATHISYAKKMLRGATVTYRPVPQTPATDRDHMPEGDSTKAGMQRLCQIISHVPTHRWPDLVGADAVSLVTAHQVEAFDEQPILEAWVQAATHSRDARLAAALVDRVPRRADVGTLVGLLDAASAVKVQRDILSSLTVEDLPHLTSMLTSPVPPQVVILLLEVVRRHARQATSSNQYILARLVEQLTSLVPLSSAAHAAQFLNDLHEQIPEETAALRRATTATAGVLTMRASLDDAIRQSRQENR